MGILEDQKATFRISADFIAAGNQKLEANLKRDYDAMGERLAREGVDIETLTARAQTFAVAVPSWGVGTGGSRFARFPGLGGPRGIDQKMEDCHTIHHLCPNAPTVSLHFPWDKPADVLALKQLGEQYGLGFDAVNSNTFQDQTGAAASYKFGSLSANSAPAREQAVAHNIECIEIGRQLGSRALTVWVGDGANFPGQSNLRGALERYLDSMRKIYAQLPDDWQMFIEHKLFEPAFYATVIGDWGTSFACAQQLGEKAKCLVDLGHHAPNTNIEMIVARLVQFGKLAGFHFNDSKYGDDDLDSGSINPFQLFLVFNELVDAELREGATFKPAYMLDQSHNVTDPVESLINSAIEVQRAYVQASLVNRQVLAGYQAENDAMMAAKTLKRAYTTDVTPILDMARLRSAGAVDPIACYRASGYRQHKARERPPVLGASGSGIV